MNQPLIGMVNAPGPLCSSEVRLPMNSRQTIRLRAHTRQSARHRSSAPSLSVEVMEKLLVSTSAMLYTRDADQLFTFISKGIVDHLGYEHTQLIENRDFWESCIHSEDLATVAAQRAALTRE